MAAAAVVESSSRGGNNSNTSSNSSNVPGGGLTMWQLSFAIESEEEARAIASCKAGDLLARAQRETEGWHDPVAALLAPTILNGPHEVSNGREHLLF